MKKKKDKLIVSRRPILKYEGLSHIIFGLCLILFVVYPFNKSTLYCFTISSFICILLTLGSLLENYKIGQDKKHLKGPFTKGQKRFMPNEWLLFKNSLWYCKKCLQIGLPLVMFVGGGLPKIAYGFAYRPPVFNYMGFPFTRITSGSEVVYLIVVDLISKDPAIIDQITLKDGHTVTLETLRPLLNDRTSFAAKAWMESLK